MELTVSLQCWQALAQWRNRDWLVRGVIMGSLLRRAVVVTDRSLMG